MRQRQGPLWTCAFLRGSRVKQPALRRPQGATNPRRAELCGKKANIPEREGTSGVGCGSGEQEARSRPAWAPTWRHPGGDGGGGHLALALGSHGGHLDGVGGERSEARDAILQGHVGQVVCHAGVGSVILLPGDPVPWEDPSGGMSAAVAITGLGPSALRLTSSLVWRLDTHGELWAKGGGSIMPGPQRTLGRMPPLVGWGCRRASKRSWRPPEACG